ncbi:MAG: sulfatase-like hydrolase/transferase [Roseburia sp.]|jgi:hypothetical protein|nr:sulfatase-like hydrolase/transferase [Roseburia sp.]
MRVGLCLEKKNGFRLAVAMIFAAALFVQKFMLRQEPVTAADAGRAVAVLLSFGGCYFLIKSLTIEVKQEGASSWVLSAVLPAAGSIFTAYHIQYLLLDAELRSRITREKMIYNILCCLVVFLVVQIVTNRAGLSCIIAHTFLMLVAGINYFVYLFRGNEFIFSDLKSIQTGLSVAGNYQFVIDDRARYVILLSALYIALMRKLHVTTPKRILAGVVWFSLAVLGSVWVGEKTQFVVTETWEQKGSYRNGYILNFVLSVRDSFVREPEGYSAETVAALEERYAAGPDAAEGGQEAGGFGQKGEPEAGGTDQTGGLETGGENQAQEAGAPASTGDAGPEEHPTIIVVMSESYADLGVVGTFRTNMDATPFYDSLTENTVKGYALSSVFGAKTPNSEWEFMTGNSMAFLPSGSVVYQQYITDTPTSIVSNLKNEGYTCVAMHPYYETGWSRNMVYPDMGFDEMYFIDDFDKTQMVREYISDQELYETIIRRFERRAANEDLFIMSISMQNHGGYTDKFENFPEPVRMLGLNYPDVNQYLSLLYESDIALEYLITYFEQVEEPVEIVFFGDHQPSLSSGFYPHLNGKGLSGLTQDELEALYTVPFFIWTNYESEAGEVEITSLNYLSTMALERAGIPLPAYNRFLSDLMEEIPAINSRGYYSQTEGGFLHKSEAAGTEAERIREYEILQYNNMFGGKEQSKIFFPYLEE